MVVSAVWGWSHPKRNSDCQADAAVNRESASDTDNCIMGFEDGGLSIPGLQCFEVGRSTESVSVFARVHHQRVIAVPKLRSTLASR